MTTLHFTVETADGARPLTLNLRRTFNLANTLRDTAKMQRHLDEVARMGIPVIPVDRPPMVSPISAWATITDADVTVQRETTSGEVEIVTIQDDDGATYVGVGSDHTDRRLEAVDLPWSKQVAPNIIAPVLWRWEDVADHWDEVTMECTITVDGTERRYQHAQVNEFWTPPEMLAALRTKIVPLEGAIAFFSGTVVSEGGQLIFAPAWTIRMTDPVLGRQITHTYTVTVLDREVLDNGLRRDGDAAPRPEP